MDDTFYIKNKTHLVLEDLYVKDRLTANDVYMSGVILNNDGSATLPAYSFINDTSTGIYLKNTNVLGLSSGGVERIEIGNTSIEPYVPIYNIDGSVSSPSYTFSGSSDTGYYLLTPDTIGLTSNEVLAIELSPTGVYYWYPFLLADGDALNPSYSFTNNTNMGIYRISANTLGLSCNGTLISSISSTSITNAVNIYQPDGDALNPSYSFSSSSTAGIYSDIPDTILISTAGVLRTTISNTYVTHTLPILVSNGTALIPSYSFSSDQNTGMYLVGANQIGVSTGGTSRWTMSTTLNTINLPTTINATTITTRALQVISNANQAQIGSFRRSGNSAAAGGLGYMSFTDVNDAELSHIGTSVISGGRPCFFFGIYNTLLASVLFRVSIGQDGSGVGIPATTMTRAPTITWQLSETNGLGLNRESSTSFACRVTNINRLTINSGDLTSSVPIINDIGSVSLPAYSFDGDINTGLYRQSTADRPAITAGGVDRIITTAPLIVTNNTTTTIISMTEANDTSIGGILVYTIEARSTTTHFGVETGKVVISGFNKAGVITNVVTKVNNQQNVSSGTLVVTWSITNTNPALVQLNANASLAQSAGFPRVTYTFENNTQQLVTLT